MDLASIMEDVQLAVKLANMAIQLGEDAAPKIQTAYDILFEGKALTPDERDAMIQQEEAWRSDIDGAIAADDASGKTE